MAIGSQTRRAAGYTSPPARRAREQTNMTRRKDLLSLLSAKPRSVSSLARELNVRAADVEEDLQHVIRSARGVGRKIVIIPARCRACGFLFDERKLVKPGKCPVCRESRIYEPQIRIEPGPNS